MSNLVMRTARTMASHFRPGNVVMYHHGRCGSTVLSEMLGQHSRILWDGELYKPIFRQWQEQLARKDAIGQMPEDPIQLLRQKMLRASFNIYGFEIKPFHHHLIGYDIKTFIRHLDRLGFSHFIILERRNRLAKIVSSLIAQNQNLYHLRDGGKAKLHQIRIDPDDIRIDYESKPLLKFLSDYDEQFCLLKYLLQNKNVLKLTYEDDIHADATKAYRRVCRFLNLDEQPVNITLTKINPFPLRRIIRNVEEIEHLLKDTPYYWMLNE